MPATAPCPFARGPALFGKGNCFLGETWQERRIRPGCHDHRLTEPIVRGRMRSEVWATLRYAREARCFDDAPGQQGWKIAFLVARFGPRSRFSGHLFPARVAAVCRSSVRGLILSHRLHQLLVKSRTRNQATLLFLPLTPRGILHFFGRTLSKEMILAVLTSNCEGRRPDSTGTARYPKSARDMVKGLVRIRQAGMVMGIYGRDYYRQDWLRVR